MSCPEFLAPVQMCVRFLLIVAALTVLATEALSIELTSLAALALLVLFFHLFPVIGPGGENRLDLRHLLSGFASPALIAVLALLVLGAGLPRTGVLDGVANRVILFPRQRSDKRRGGNT